ncbi:unnamed protein product [Cochlearia groenlandica]
MIRKLAEEDPDEVHDDDKKDVEKSGENDEKKGQYTKFWNEFGTINKMSTNYDVLLSFQGLDTSRNLISFLHNELVQRRIQTFKDFNYYESKFAVVIISKNYTTSRCFVEELVKIMESVEKGSLTVMPIFYDVDPCHLRWNFGEVAEQFKKHEEREDSKKVFLWREALTKLSNISDHYLRPLLVSKSCFFVFREDDSRLVDRICDRISKKLRTTTKTISYGNVLVGIDAHMKAIHRLLDLKSNKKRVTVVRIWARGFEDRLSV